MPARCATGASLDMTGTRSLRIRACPKSAELCADELGRLGEINTGDPETLIDFLAWTGNFPRGTATSLILWGHGAGWKSGRGDVA